MRILLTGASSFTGVHFAKALAARGHEVVAPLPRPREAYDGVRAARVEALAGSAAIEHGVRFGDDRFLAILREGSFDLLAHHAARVEGYRSPDFDAVGAAAENTHRLPEVLAEFANRGGRRVLLTGSVFEAGEGAGSDGLPSFSPYGLSKALTAEVFRYYTCRSGVGFGKFVIPNPFGVMEEPRFTTYLAKTWLAGKTAEVRTPDYVRDNIHVGLLALAYADFAERLPDRGFARLGPSGYAESQGAFTKRFAEAMRPRFDLPCAVELGRQTDWAEPAVRVNLDPVARRFPEFDEGRAFDELAAWYLREIGRP